ADADPRQADDEQDLPEGEVADAKLLLELCAPPFDARLGAGKFVGRRFCRRRHRRTSPSSSQDRAHASSPSCSRWMRKNSFGAWKSSSAVEKEKNTVSRPMWR